MGLERPREGGRVVLTRKSVGVIEVAYEVALHGSAGSWEGTAIIAVDGGEVGLGSFAGEGAAEPPPWLVGAARAFLRTVWAGRQRENPPVWPRRIRRWRVPKG